MDIFLDTGVVKEVEELITTGLIDGITTNPSLAAKSGISFEDLIKTMAKLTSGPVSAEVIALDTETMIEQGRKLAKLAENVVVKVPLTMDGLKACKALVSEDIMVNVTLCFSANQALLAAKSGATFVSPFIGRIDDHGNEGMKLIEEIRQIFDAYAFDTAILAASIRHPIHVVQAAKAGADIATLPPKVFRQLYHHPLTDIGLKNFISDWEKSGLTI
ncbi:MAG TPA: fructose-6-phosphate aldolase [Candidatus Nitrosotenuis sp.]|jgi:transaldolase|nr:fructose-6-phosphate aldolase [Candidatus Nitrosotenuis sp.]